MPAPKPNPAFTAKNSRAVRPAPKPNAGSSRAVRPAPAKVGTKGGAPMPKGKKK